MKVQLSLQKHRGLRACIPFVLGLGLVLVLDWNAFSLPRQACVQPDDTMAGTAFMAGHTKLSSTSTSVGGGMRLNHNQ
jgi:hypothetical protein